MNRDVFLKLLTLKLAGELTADQQEQFNQALAGNAEYQLIATQLLNTATANSYHPDTQAKLTAVWDSIAQEQAQPTAEIRRFKLAPLLKIAAAILLVLSAAIIWYQHSKTDPPELLIHFNTANHKLYKTLDDGTIIYLNSHSAISYNQQFGKTKREITLQGEAFFDVTKNKAVPLFIHVGQLTIEVKGTAFNVSEQRKQVEIALIHGRIEISSTLNKSQIVGLNPQQRVIFTTGPAAKAQAYKILPLDVAGQTATLLWTRDSLVFKKEKLVNLALLLEKKYQVKIEIRNEKLKLKQFSGVIKNEQLTEALDALKLSYPFTYAIINKVIIIK